jgi:hypothetical protein
MHMSFINMQMSQEFNTQDRFSQDTMAARQARGFGAHFPTLQQSFSQVFICHVSCAWFWRAAANIL